MRRAEQLSKVADSFAEPLRGGVMEVSDGEIEIDSEENSQLNNGHFAHLHG
jgi:hypothetical protein